MILTALTLPNLHEKIVFTLIVFGETDEMNVLMRLSGKSGYLCYWFNSI